MRDVKSIGFGFENCEYFSIDAKYFGAFQLTDFCTSIHRVASNAILKMNLVDTVVMEIFSEGNGQYKPFGVGDEVNNFFDRLQTYDDITSISVTYDDDTVEEYYVDYKEAVEDQLGSPNVYQHTYMNKFGDLYIIINKDKGIFDFFDEEEINDKDNLEFEKTMILD